MDWLKDRVCERVDALREARGHRGWLYGFAAFLVLTALVEAWPSIQKWVPQWIQLPPSGEGVVMIWGLPFWAYGLPLALVCLCAWLFENMVKLRRSLAPRIRPSFDQRSGVVLTPEKQWFPDGKVVEYKIALVRLQLDALHRAPVRNCAASIVRIQKRLIPTADFIEIEMPNPHFLSDGNPVDVYPRIPRLLAFLRVTETDNKLLLTGAWPFLLEDIFDDHATHRFTIIVIGADVDHEILVEVDWAGQWNKITARQV
jgi:hypothetical protein